MKANFIFLVLFMALSGIAQRPIHTFAKDGITIRSYDFNVFAPYLTQSNDTTYVVNFWATWCQPCVAELPQFEKLNVAYKAKKVKVILVSLDMKSQVESRLIPFIKHKKIASEVIHLGDPDMNTWIPKVSTQWEGSIPATVIYNAAHREFHEGSYTYKELENQLKRFIP